jgi:hypothetical protein
MFICVHVCEAEDGREAYTKAYAKRYAKALAPRRPLGHRPKVSITDERIPLRVAKLVL